MTYISNAQIVQFTATHGLSNEYPLNQFNSIYWKNSEGLSKVINVSCQNKEI